MNKKFRYGLIIIGILVFCISVPLIILFVSGKKLNWQTKKIISTGIVAFKIEPEDAKIFLNHAPQDLSNTEYKYIRDLQQGQYLFEAKQHGYYTWQAPITLEPNRVLWIKPETQKIILLKTPSTTPTFLTNIKDLLVNQNELLAISENSLYILKKNNSSGTPVQLTLPQTLEELTASPDADYVFLWSNANPKKPLKFLIDVNTKTISNLTDILPHTFKHLTITDQGKIVFLEKTKLYQLNSPNSQPIAIMGDDNVTSLVSDEENIYYLVKDPKHPVLKSLNLNTLDTQILSTLPTEISEPTLQAVIKKQIYFNSGSKLYSLSSDGNITKISDQFSNATTNLTSLLSWQKDDTYYYINSKNSLNSVFTNRNSILKPIISEELGYLFFTDTQHIYGLELSLNPTPNQFLLYSGTRIKKFFLSEDKKTLWLLDDQSLKNLRFR